MNLKDRDWTLPRKPSTTVSPPSNGVQPDFSQDAITSLALCLAVPSPTDPPRSRRPLLRCRRGSLHT